MMLEGNDVQFLSLKKEGKEHLLNMIPHAKSLQDGVNWVGKKGYIICGDETDVTPLRKRGYRVYGGNAFTQKIEKDRNFQASVLDESDIPTPNHHSAANIDEAIKFIKSHPDQYVLKQMGNAPKHWNFVGKHGDGSDVIDQLEWMKIQPEFKKLGKVPFMLQEFVDGIEFAVSGYWIGNDWKRRDDGSLLLEINKEHKKVLNEDLGVTCGEMGTCIKFTDNEKLFSQTLEKLTPALKKYASDVVLNIDANCGICLEDGEPKAYVYEITPREGYPATDLQQNLLTTPITEFFMDLIERKQGNVEHTDDWGVVTVLASGRFPYESRENHTEGSFHNQPVIIPQWNEGKEFYPNIHPCFIKFDPNKGYFRVSNTYEYLLTVTHHASTIEEANYRCVKDMKMIETRAPFFRTDIGRKFESKELPQLEEWGYV